MDELKIGRERKYESPCLNELSICDCRVGVDARVASDL